MIRPISSPFAFRRFAILAVVLATLSAHSVVVWAQVGGERGIAPVASSSDIEVSGIEVDVRAESGIAALEQAWEEAQRKAWARLDGPSHDKALHRFYHEFDWDGGPMLLQSRAIDSEGYVQPTKDALRAVRGTESIYHNNAIQTWHVREGAEVENVEVG
mgnify:CR=1 FL=1